MSCWHLRCEAASPTSFSSTHNQTANAGSFFSSSSLPISEGASYSMVERPCCSMVGFGQNVLNGEPHRQTFPADSRNQKKITLVTRTSDAHNFSSGDDSTLFGDERITVPRRMRAVLTPQQVHLPPSLVHYSLLLRTVPYATLRFLEHKFGFHYNASGLNKWLIAGEGHFPRWPSGRRGR